MARQAAQGLMDLLGDIIDFSKIDSGRLELRQAPFDLRGCVEGVIATFTPEAQAKGLELGFEVAPEVPRLLLGDAARLAQVLHNLIGNGIKFTEAGGVDVAVEVAAEVAGGRELRFTVNDTGIGIPADKVESIFDSFTQVDDSSTRTYDGSGLGLALCRRLVRMMDGEILARSEFGRGASFIFTARFGEVTEDDGRR
jgi:signal transduction histidine kinase